MRFVGLLRRVLLCLIAAGAAGCGDGSGITGPDTAPSYVRLQSNAGDYIGGGQTYNYTRANAVITVTASEGLLSIRIDGDQWWFGDFQSPSGINQLQPGSYTNVQRYPFHDPAKGGLSWSGDGRGCNTLSGSFTVDKVSYVDGNLATIDLRFEQHCEGGIPALHGAIRWGS
jgi:hypothetical protein